MLDSSSRYTCLAAPAIVLIAILAAAAIALWLPVHALTHLMREGGPIESATALLYMAAVGAVCLVRNPSFGRPAKAMSVVLLGCCAAREVSVRRILLEADIGAYCCSPAQARFAIGVLLVLLVAAVAWLAARYARAILAGFKRRRPVAVTLMTIFGSALLSQLLDRVKIGATLLGYTLSGTGRALALSLEEVLEMTLPALVVLAVLQADGRVQDA
jgi:hypothetical protein